MTAEVKVRRLGRTRYQPVFEAMRTFTGARTPRSPDELWLTEHEPVFTQGQAGKAEHLLMPGDIPVVQSDRGGQVTYHGPGQIVGYLMFDLRRLNLTVRGLVRGIEQAVVETLAGYGVDSAPRPDAPGVYVDGAKIASLGLRVRRGCSYHGLALNVDMDLEPFGRINPCGLLGMRVTQLRDLAGPADVGEVSERLLASLESVYGVRFAAAGPRSVEAPPPVSSPAGTP